MTRLLECSWSNEVTLSHPLEYIPEMAWNDTTASISGKPPVVFLPPVAGPACISPSLRGKRDKGSPRTASAMFRTFPQCLEFSTILTWSALKMGDSYSMCERVPR